MKTLIPDYIFEASWEVCNRVGGIYTVLSTKAASLVSKFGQNLIFIGPDVWGEAESPFFIPNDNLFTDWVVATKKEGLKVRVGNWDIPGRPVVFLIDFNDFYQQKDSIYANMWNWFGVDSLHAYGDYDESSMFGYACGVVVESFLRYNKLTKKKVVAHFNEWMTAFGELYLKQNMPNVATVFTTHATSIGRSIAGNNKPLYDYLSAYNGDQMAEELNMQSKHSVEKRAAHNADCFTTVSNVTAKECLQLLEKMPDVVTPNGFENDFVPKAKVFSKKRTEARLVLRRVAEKMLGYKLAEDVMFIGTSGRYEFKNKGIDVFIEALKRASDAGLKRETVAFVMVPAYTSNYRIELTENSSELCYGRPFATHYLHYEEHDPVLNSIRWFNFSNAPESSLKIIFVPSYLNGDDGIFNKSYYDILIGLDLTVFPSYYEPWGYTPLESAAFGIPTITTNLSGFGQWVSDSPQSIENGVGIVPRTDYNYNEVVNDLSMMMVNFIEKSESERKKINKKVNLIAQKALWENFIEYYYEAFNIALNNKNKRIKTLK
ncbi:glycogen/starch synthase [bacterium]|nr:glycogen/starch synthase [bacterium]